jgi:hypothetical protein
MHLLLCCLGRMQAVRVGTHPLQVEVLAVVNTVTLDEAIGDDKSAPILWALTDSKLAKRFHKGGGVLPANKGKLHTTLMV